MGAVLVGADLVQAAANRDPARARDGEGDFAGDYDVPFRQFPGRFDRVALKLPGVGGSDEAAMFVGISEW